MEQILKLIVAIQMRAVDFREKDRGATATEYAILVAFVALAIIVGATLFGAAVSNWFSNLASTVNGWAS